MSSKKREAVKNTAASARGAGSDAQWQPEPRKKLVRRFAAPFFVAMFAITIVAWILPLRPAYSAQEKRALEKFPEFSVAALLDGSFFKGVDSWFSDTFPGRQGWVQASNIMDTLRGVSQTAIYGDIAIADEIPEISSGRESESERDKPPAATPAPTPSVTVRPTPTPSPADAEETPKTAGEGLGQEDEWGGVDVEGLETYKLNAVLQVGDAAYEYFGFSQYNADRYASVISSAAQLLDGKANVYDILIPNSMGVMLPDEFQDSAGSSSQKDAIDYIYSCMDPLVQTVETFSALRGHNSEYLYFRSDHHWTALGAWYAYEQFAYKAGLEPALLSDYLLIEFPGFLGTFYYTVTNRTGMGNNPDTVYAYDPPGDITMRIYENGTGYGYEWPVLTDMSASSRESKYMTFLAGDHALCIIKNNDITDGSACMLVKESYGNPFAPYLSQHYQYVYVVDYRYYGVYKLTSFVEQYDIDDVIFLNGVTMALGSGALGLIDSLVQ